MALVPTDKEQLFSHQVKWDVVDQSGLVESKMKPWITKKIAEFLGEEEASMIQFVASMLQQHTPAKDVVDKLSMILEDEAEAFVVKLWRMLIFEYMRYEVESAAGL